MLEEIISRLQIGSSGPLQVLVNMSVALVLALITSFIYRLTHSGYAYSRSYNITMICVALVITLMMMAISNYLVLSLGLIGALSVIRFRTAIKDPRDIAYLFICIAIGLVCSTGDYAIATVGTLFINAILFILHYLHFGTKMSSDYVLTFNLKGDQNQARVIAEKAREIFPKVVFRSYCKLNKDESQYVYSLKLGKISEEEAIALFTEDHPQIEDISLIAPETNIEL